MDLFCRAGIAFRGGAVLTMLAYHLWTFNLILKKKSFGFRFGVA